MEKRAETRPGLSLSLTHTLPDLFLMLTHTLTLTLTLTLSVARVGMGSRFHKSGFSALTIDKVVVGSGAVDSETVLSSALSLSE